MMIEKQRKVQKYFFSHSSTIWDDFLVILFERNSYFCRLNFIVERDDDLRFISKNN
jgi:phosphomevalonate kinase